MINLKNRIQAEYGFTVMEVFIVATVLVIIASISFLSLRSFGPTFRLSGAARDLATDLRYVQELSVAQQKECGIIFVDLGKYRLVEYGTSTAEIESKNLPEGITFQEINFPDQKVAFNPYGAAKEAGSVVLKSQDKQKSIEVKPSGFVKITD